MQAIDLGLMAFFIITGYFYRPERGFIGNMRPRSLLLVGLIICSVLFPIIVYLWAILFGQDPGIGDLVTALRQGFSLEGAFEDITYTLGTPVSFVSPGCYYLWVMLLSYIVFYALAGRIHGKPKLEILSVAVMLAIQCLYIEFIHLCLPLSAQMTPIAVAFMVLGMMLSERKVLERIEDLRCTESRYWTPLALCLLIGGVLVFLFHPGISFDKCVFGDFGGYSVFPYFLEASLFFVIFVYIMVLICRIPFFHIPFIEMGKHTLGTLLLHAFLAKILLMPFFTFTDHLMPDMEMGAAVLVALVVLILCYVICRLFLTLAASKVWAIGMD